jgi:flagellin-like protein
MNVTKGLSYVVGVLVVLAVTLAAVVAFSQILGFQAGVLTSLQALDVRRLGESLVPVEGIRVGGNIILYNNGQIPTCFLELRIVGTTYGYSASSCTAIPPRQTGVVSLGATIPRGEYVVIARTLNNKIVTFRVTFR